MGNIYTSEIVSGEIVSDLSNDTPTPIIPSRDSIGYKNLVEKVKKIRMEMDEFVIVDLDT